jgi:hypothetical protein
VGVFTLFSAFPFDWMLITTFERNTDLLRRENNPFIYNEPPTLEHLRVLFVETLYGRWLVDTAFVEVLGAGAPPTRRAIERPLTAEARGNGPPGARLASPIPGSSTLATPPRLARRQWPGE